MKEIVVISGKGGTGKTSFVASLAALAENPVLADCDVDAADLAIVLAPRVRRQGEFRGGKRASIRTDLCNGCGECVRLCAFGAIEYEAVEGVTGTEAAPVYRVDPVACEGCGVCAHFCPRHAVDFGEVVNGRWYLSDTRFGPLVYAELGIAEENSGKLVSLVRNQAREEAERLGSGLLIIDGPPGTGCPVIASVTGADLVVIVSEPTISGLHDAERVLKLARHFDIPALICVNKYDINLEVAEKIESIAGESCVLGRIPYDLSVVKAQVAGKAVVEYSGGPASEAIREAWASLGKIISTM